MTRLAEGTEITTHQRVLALGPRLVTPDGAPAVPDCPGAFRVQEGDRGRGPIIVECDECGLVTGLARREANATLPLAAVGAGADPDTDADGYARF